MSDQTTSRPDAIIGRRTPRRLPSIAFSEERDEQNVSNAKGTTASETQSMRKYAVTYAFTDCLRGKSGHASSLITETVAAMQRDGININFLGATQEIDSEGWLTEVTARYAAPSKGTIGRLNCRACLPASGPPQLDESGKIDSTGRNIAVAGH